MLVKEYPVLQYNEFYMRYGRRESQKRAVSMMPLFKYIIKELKNFGAKNVLDIGCGAGDFLSICRDNGIAYHGFDFSSVAIAICRGCDKLDDVWVGDARDVKNYTERYDAYIAIEVLEHIAQDFDVIKHLKPNVLFIFSLPNWVGRDAHVRFFESDAQIRARYDKIIDIKSIVNFRANRNRERRVVVSMTKMNIGEQT